MDLPPRWRCLALCLLTARAAPARSHEGTGAKTVLMSFDKRELTEVIQFVSQFTGRNFILPERVSGKITILSNAPIPADQVWSVFLAALDANNWAVYPAGSYWKLTEKKQAPRAGIPTLLDRLDAPPQTEQMVTKLYKLQFADAEQLKNVLAQFTSRDSDVQAVPPDTLIVSELGMNLSRIERLIEQLDHPAGSQELRVVQVEHAAAPELAQKLTEVLQAQGASKSPPKILADERTNQLVILAGDKAWATVQAVLQKLDVPSGDGGVHLYALRNGKAEEVATTLNAVVQGMTGKKRAAPAATGSSDTLSGEIKITPDKITNSLVVTASQADWRSILKLIERLDGERRQVFVEAVIMEVTVGDDSELGASLHGGSQQSGSVGVLGSEVGGLNSIAGLSSLSSLNGFLAGIQGAPITVSGVTLPSFGIVLQALQSASNANVISTPHLLMTDNTEAEIAVGQNVPFQSAFQPSVATTTATTATSLASLYAPIQRQNVELRLKLRPQITDGGKVRLEVDEQTEEIASVDKTLGPTTSKRSAKTTVVARDQETIVIGGLMQERITRAVSKVPILGSLPVIGWFFRSESTKKQKTNLLLILTPYIIRDQDDVRHIFERKMAERDEFVRRFSNDGAQQRRSIDYEHKPGALERIRRGADEELAKAENGGQGAAGERIVGSGGP